MQQNLAKVILTMIHSFNFNDEKTMLKCWCWTAWKVTITGQNLLKVKLKIKKLEVLLLQMNNMQNNQWKYHMLVVSVTLDDK